MTEFREEAAAANEDLSNRPGEHDELIHAALGPDRDALEQRA